MMISFIFLRRHLTIIVLLLLSCALSAKDYYVQGTVVDYLHKRYLPGMTVDLLRTDSTLVSSCLSKEKYNPPYAFFTLPVKVEGDYILRFSMLGYRTTFENIKVKYPRGSSVVEVGVFEIKEQVYQLKETSVVASQIKMVMKGDTVVYNASAFQLAEGSMLDALISQLPGVELKDDGQIFVNGKFVKNLLLNGKDFFKGDPKFALENLPAYMVDKVKVYDKTGRLSDFMKRDMGDKEYVMDVRLKKQYSIGWIANAEVGGGTEDRYMGRLFGLRFTDNSRLTVFANLNNLNDNRRPGRSGDWRPGDMPTGLQTTQVGGISYNLEKNGKKRISVTSDNKVECYDANSIINTNKITFLPAGDMFNRSYDNSRNKQVTYSSRNSVFYNTPKYVINGGGGASYKTSDGSGIRKMGTFSSNPSDLNAGNVLDTLFSPDMGEAFRRMIVNRRQQEVMSDGSFLNGSAGSSIWIKHLNKTLIIGGSFQVNKYDDTSFNRSNLEYFSESGHVSSDYQDQYFDKSWNRREYMISAQYIYSIVDNWSIGGHSITLRPFYTFHSNVKSGHDLAYRLDRLPGWEEADEQPFGNLPSSSDAMQSVIDLRNSSLSAVYKMSHDFRLQFQVFNFKKNDLEVDFNLNLRGSALKEELKYHRNNVYYPLTRNSFLFYPDMKLQIGRKNKGTLEWSSNIQEETPELTHLIDIRDDSDPLNISLGNPNLKNKQRYSTALYYWRFWKETQTNLNISGGYIYTKNDNATGMVYNRANGVRTYRPDNINGNYKINGNAKFSRAIGKKKCWSFSSATSFTYNHNVDLFGVAGAIESERSTVHNRYFGETLKLDYRMGGKFNIGVKMGANWTYSTSEREDFNTINAGNINYGLTGLVELPWKMQLSTDLTQYSRRGYDDPNMNSNELVWNARLSKTCMKGNMTFMLDGFDILGNLSNVRQTINAQGRTESYYNVIPRYAMLHVMYKLNVQPKKRK